MIPPDASLSRLLTLVEQWKCPGHTCCDTARALAVVDLSALRAAAQQHAEALRGSVKMPNCCDRCKRESKQENERIYAAADWLAKEEA